MTDYTDSLIKNLVHSAPKLSTTSLTERLNQLTETLRYARSSLSLASLTHVLAGTKPPSASSCSSSETPLNGTLELHVVEGRNLAIANPSKADIYCLLACEGSVTSTPGARTNQSADPFELAIKASCPKWQYSTTFDVSNDQVEYQVFVYDRGNRLPNGDERCLGMLTIKPTLVPRRTVDMWYKLEPHCLGQDASGEIRVQATLTVNSAAKLTPESFRIVRLLGHGSFGKVYQVIKRDTNRTYAMKVLSKKALIAQNEVAHTLTERNVLIRTFKHPYVVSLKFSFQTADHLFLVMDYVPGGEMFAYLQQQRYLSEAHAQFYLAEIVCALEAIHAHDVVYRDLKPENILLDADGHVALTDFGLSKELKDEKTTRTFCGTSEYLAPEMVLHKSYTAMIDWWSLGILLYEMLTGNPPFHSAQLDTLYSRICQAPVKFRPSLGLSEECKDLIMGLLQRNPRERLGKNGASEIKAHPWFKNVQWSLVANKRARAPYIPTTTVVDRPRAPRPIGIPRKKTSTSTVRTIDSIDSQAASFLTRKGTSLSTSNQSAFRGFSYVREASYQRSGFLSDDEDEDAW
ncbi:hypothetical protein DFQ28_001228 [Apophysomyces sp. BC1034]|nr:hypothetical protein DFQ30_008582 [Apophysomyces sp. BC1015]KAG0180459.1 hypothetical protein DFQ29_000658 [Apophysomyces sp. BC1021]KAG0190927.1 hypothetical protein DFQ28_001228 [Apophysomyces sp. BC1034]